MNQTTKKQSKNQTVNVNKICFTAMFGALAGALMFIRFPLPFFPTFFDMDFAAVPEIIGAYMFGPIAGICIVFLKMIIKVIFSGTQSFGAGEIQNIILSLVYILPTSIIYKYNKSKDVAVITLAIDTVLVTIAAIFSNIYFIFPYFANMMGCSFDDLIAMCAAINPAIKNTFTLTAFAIAPFNLIKYGVSSILTILVYKRLSIALKKITYN